MSSRTGYREGTHLLKSVTNSDVITIEIVSMKNGDWKWYNEDKGWSKSYGASDVALAMACQNLKAKPIS